MYWLGGGADVHRPFLIDFVRAGIHAIMICTNTYKCEYIQYYIYILRLFWVSFVGSVSLDSTDTAPGFMNHLRADNLFSPLWFRFLYVYIT